MAVLNRRGDYVQRRSRLRNVDVTVIIRRTARHAHHHPGIPLLQQPTGISLITLRELFSHQSSARRNSGMVGLLFTALKPATNTPQAFQRIITIANWPRFSIVGGIYRGALTGGTSRPVPERHYP